MTASPTESVDDMVRRFQRLKGIEHTKYRCNAYGDDAIVCSPTLQPDEKAVLLLRSDRVLLKREVLLLEVYALADHLGIDRAVTGNASFLFDRYLSTFIPSYVTGTANLPHRFDAIGIASLFITAKFHMTRAELGRIDNFVRDNRYSEGIFQAELDILVKLHWDIIYPSPISIMDDLLTLLPRPKSYQEYIGLKSFKKSVLNIVTPLLKLASVKYGYVTNFPPSTIALAALTIAMEKQQSPSREVGSRRLSIFHLIQFITNVESVLDCSCDDPDVKKCRDWMMEHSKDSGSRASISEKRSCSSPTNVFEF